MPTCRCPPYMARPPHHCSSALVNKRRSHYHRWMNPQDYEADEKKAKSVAAAEAAAALVRK